MIRSGFLDGESRRDLIDLARDVSALHGLGRRANALVLLDDGMSCARVAKLLFVDDDTVRQWHHLYLQDGVDGLAGLGRGGSACRLSAEQQDLLVGWVGQVLPRTTREIGAWIGSAFDISYQGRSGLIALLHRLGIEYRKPQSVPRKLDVATQQAFIDDYKLLQKSLLCDEVVMFADAVHPTHSARPAGCWAPKDVRVALEQNSGRERLNIHGAIDLETGKTRMVEVLTVNAESTIDLLSGIEKMYPDKHRIHVFLDNARYHHARLVKQWLERPGCRVKLHFIPPYCPHLDPIERLWGLMHKHVTHNKCYAKFKDFANHILAFLREDVPRNWLQYCDTVSDNFRIINPKDLRVLA